MKTESLEFQREVRRTPVRRRKLVLVESAAAIAGVQQTTLYLVESLDRLHWDTLVVCPEQGDLTEACRRAGVATRVLPLPFLWSTSFWVSNRRKLPNPAAWVWNAASILMASYRVAALLAEERPDLVLSKGLLCHFYCGLAARRLNIPCIWHLEDLISPRFGGIYRWVFNQLAARLPTRLSVNGAQTLRPFRIDVCEKTSIVPNAINTQLFRPSRDGSSIRREFGIEPGEVLIGSVARLTPWKGQDLLVDAFAQLVRHTPAKLLVVGSALFESRAFETHLRAKVQSLGLEDHVHFTGHRKDVAQLLAAMDIFAYTAVEKDVWPLSVLQAMAAGLPVVAFDIEGVREAIGCDENAILIPPSSVTRLAQALGELAVRQDLRCRLGEAARKRAEDAFTLDRYVSQMVASFDKTLDLSNAPVNTP